MGIASRTALGHTQPPIQWVPGTLSSAVKQPGREADHSPPSSAEVKEWVELYLHSYNTPSWRGAQLKHRDNLTFFYRYGQMGSSGRAGRDSDKYSSVTFGPVRFSVCTSNAFDIQRPLSNLSLSHGPKNSLTHCPLPMGELTEIDRFCGEWILLSGALFTHIFLVRTG
jgi:hypothetical protein